MAKDRLTLYDKYGNERDVDISSEDVTLDNENGKTLKTKLNEIDNAFDATVKKVIFNGDPKVVLNGEINIGNQMQPDWSESSTSYPSYIRNKPTIPTRTSELQNDAGFITASQVPEASTVDDDISSTSENPVQNKVIKAYIDNLINGLVNSAPAALDTLNELAAALGNDANFAATITQQLANKISGIKKHDGQALTPDSNGIVTLPEQTEVEAVSVTTNQDGTFTIHVGETDYTINLNHTHENMAKIVKCTEATLPQTFDDDDTIYVQVDNLTSPTEIEALHIFGLEFTGGGGYTPGTPHLTRPSQTQISNGINIGYTTNGVATYLLNIKAKDLTQSLLVEWGNGSTGYSFDTTDLPTGVTYDSGTGKLTITKETACGINGVDIPVVYTGNDTDENAEGTIGISSSSADGINKVVTLIVNKVTYEDLAGVKLTGQQYIELDYRPNPSTKLEIDLQFEENANKNSTTAINYWTGTNSSAENGRFQTTFSSEPNEYSQLIFWYNDSSNNSGNHIFANIFNRSTFTYDNNTVNFQGVNVHLTTKTTTQIGNMLIGAYYSGSAGSLLTFNRHNIKIFSIKISEGGTTLLNLVPKLKNGTVAGLYDTIHDTFYSSETATPIEAITT